MSTNSAATPATSVTVAVFEDGLGRRYRPVARGDNDAPEILCFDHELTAIPSFEFALRERVGTLAEFHHSYYARIRRVERLNDDGGTLALVSECAPGTRLADILAFAERQGLVLDVDAALCLLRQLVPAVALLHKNARVTHGAIGPERLVITPNARLVVVEHVIGPALEQLHYSRERYWKDLRVALPPSAGLPRLDDCADITQLGVVALSLVLGRLLHDDEYPAAVEDVIATAWARSAQGDREPLMPGFRFWITRALQLDGRNSFRSLPEAQAALDQLFSGEGSYMAGLDTLEAFLARYHQSLEPPPAPKMQTPSLTVPGAWRPDRSIARKETISEPPPPPVLRSQPIQPAVELSTKTTRPAPGRRGWIAAGLVLLVATGGGLFGARRYLSPAVSAQTTGTLAVETNPPGAQVTVDGEQRGQTPVSLSLKPGAHTLIIRGDGEPRTIPVTISAGALSSQYLELPKAHTPTGQLQIRTEPSGARVTVDGLPRGIAPVTIADLPPGEHSVKLESDLGSMEQRVTIEAGITASLFVPLSLPQGASVSGWVSVSAPVEMQLYEQGRLLGTSEIDRLMLSTGKHDIDIVNEPLGYRVTRTVQVAAGRVSPIRIDLPKGTVALNAVPWAEVLIDGQSVGETPIGNLSVTIGPHEVIFRNPELGEQRRAITVTLNSPARLSIDLSKK
jgi:hypothetical protein